MTQKPNRRQIVESLTITRNVVARDLLQECYFAIRGLQQLAEKVEKEKKAYNSLGALQSTAMNIDRRCGELTRLNEAIAVVQGKEKP